VKRYYEILNHLSTDMNAAALASITAPVCSCRAFVHDIRETAAKHQRYFGVDHILAMKPVYAGPQTVQVLVRYSSAGGGIKTSSGTIVHRGKPTHDASLNFQLNRRNDRWLIYRIDLLSKGSS
jgi:3-hydroxymyristoyl/3-hydroxydecanoyl-(acyl carrier protein) dehydratase